MKLRNKKTGEKKDVLIKTIEYSNSPLGYPKHKVYNSIAELSKEWEDYKEPERYYYIDRDGHIVETQNTRFLKGLDNKIYDVERAKSIGNIFTTQEEAEKAVEKLKAWKRLKDKGFRFNKWYFHDILGGDVVIIANFENNGENDEDLDLLFGGEK